MGGNFPPFKQLKNNIMLSNEQMKQRQIEEDEIILYQRYYDYWIYKNFPPNRY